MKKQLIGFLAALTTYSIGFVFADRHHFEIAIKTPVATDVAIQRPSVDESDVQSSLELRPPNDNGLYAWYLPPADAPQLRGEVGFIALSGELSEKNGRVVYEARVMTNFYDDVDRDYAHPVMTKVVGDRLTFRTKAVKGVSFSFDGTFFKVRRTGEQNEPVLRGTLTRLVKGKPAGAFTGDFGYAEPHCLH